MKWFKHDSDAHADAKLRKVRLKYGMQGYGLYWYCLELIARGVEKHRLTFELEHDAELIAADTGISRDLVEDMMRYMSDIGLFEQSCGVITCLKMAHRTDEYTAKLISKSPNVPIVSRQNPDSVGIKSALREEKRLEQNRTEEIINTSPNGDVRVLRKRRPPVPFAEIVDLYHQCLPELSRVEKLTKTREGYIRQRWQEDLTDLSHWRHYFDFVRQSAFLMGRSKPTNGKPPFRADLEWITRPNNYAKIAEEKYHG